MNQSNPANTMNGYSQQRRRRGGWSRFLGGFLMGALLAGSAVVYSQVGRGTQLGFSGPGWFGRHNGTGTIETAMERAEFATDWMLTRIQATDEQRQRVKAIVDNAIRDLYPAKEQHQQNRQALVQALLQTPVDRGALETARQSELQLAETVSSRLVGVLADVSEILTPEQRAQPAERVSRFHH
jgi:Spy/CpxP family protein refolding chaperone